METRKILDGVAVDIEPPDDMSVFKKIGNVIKGRTSRALAVGAVVGLSAGNIAFDRGGKML